MYQIKLNKAVARPMVVHHVANTCSDQHQTVPSAHTHSAETFYINYEEEQSQRNLHLNQIRSVFRGTTFHQLLLHIT